MRGGSRKQQGVAKHSIERGCALAFAHEIHTAKQMTNNASGNTLADANRSHVCYKQ